MCFPKKKIKKKKKHNQPFPTEKSRKVRKLILFIYSYLYPVEVYANGEITFIFFIFIDDLSQKAWIYFF